MTPIDLAPSRCKSFRPWCVPLIIRAQANVPFNGWGFLRALNDVRVPKLITSS